MGNSDEKLGILLIPWLSTKKIKNKKNYKLKKRMDICEGVAKCLGKFLGLRFTKSKQIISCSGPVV